MRPYSSNIREFETHVFFFFSFRQIFITETGGRITADASDSFDQAPDRREDENIGGSEEIE